MSLPSSAAAALEAAKGHEAGGRGAQAASAAADALFELLRSIVSLPSAGDGVERLQAPEVTRALELTARLNEELLASVRRGEMPSSSLGGTYHFSAFGHLALLAGDVELVRRFVGLAITPEAQQTGTRFWNAYACAFGRLLGLARVEYEVPGKLRGGEKYWVSYLRLMECAAEGGERGAAIQRARGSFTKRNSDKRLRDDMYGVEGTGQQPVKWDFRLDSLTQANVNPEGQGAARCSLLAYTSTPR